MNGTSIILKWESISLDGKRYAEPISLEYVITLVSSVRMRLIYTYIWKRSETGRAMVWGSIIKSYFGPKSVFIFLPYRYFWSFYNLYEKKELTVQITMMIIELMRLSAPINLTLDCHQDCAIGVNLFYYQYVLLYIRPILREA